MRLCAALSGEKGGGSLETVPRSADRMKRNRSPGVEKRWEEGELAPAVRKSHQALPG